MWPDIGIMPKAAKRVIVSTEEIVDTEILRQHPERTILPGFMVDAVVEVPYGAHPTSFFPNYGYDSRFHLEWTGVARDRGKAADFLHHYVQTPSTQDAYLATVGGAALLEHIEKWEDRA
jgi:glutaconate CoA-transferase subunit A